MPLTPNDVHNVAFKKPSLGKRGYDEDEVDVFLDLVEQELARLIDENRDLRQRVADLEDEGAPGGRVADEQPSAQATKILGMAQEMADRLTADARAESEATLTSARASADEMVSGAREKSQSMLGQARDRAEAMVVDARSKAEKLLTDAKDRAQSTVAAAQDKANRLAADAEKQHTEILGAINAQRGLIEGRIEQLRTFEREYRSRLKAYFEAQLEDLAADESAAPAPNVDAARARQVPGNN